MEENNNDHKALENFIIDNIDLEKLEEKVSEFNIIEAMGAVRQELRHSDILSYLLNPNENHGLGDDFLKRLLQRLILSLPSFPLSAIEIDTSHFSNVEIRREWNNIDILIIINEPNLKLICAFENKIKSKERTGQLVTYKEILNREYIKFNQLLIFLTPDGEDATDNSWLSIEYQTIFEVLKKSLVFRTSSLSDPVKILIDHYLTILDRYIMSESAIAELCRKIYSKHKKAIDLINEHKPDLQQEIKIFLENLITKELKINLVLDHCSKSAIRFAPKEWDDYDVQNTGKGWTDSKRLLLFEFRNYSNNLSLTLLIGPGDANNRQRIFECIDDKKSIFKNASKKLYDKWTQIYSMKILDKKVFEDPSIEDLYKKIDTHWNTFIESEIQNISKSINWENIL